MLYEDAIQTDPKLLEAYVSLYAHYILIMALRMATVVHHWFRTPSVLLLSTREVMRAAHFKVVIWSSLKCPEAWALIIFLLMILFWLQISSCSWCDFFSRQFCLRRSLKEGTQERKANQTKNKTKNAERQTVFLKQCNLFFQWDTFCFP